MTTDVDTQELRETVLLGSRILDREGIMDSSGHLSFRIPGTTQFVLPARMAPGIARLEHLMVVDEDGNVLEGEGTRPLEWAIHARIYRARPDIDSVMHSHSPMSRLFSVSSEPLRPVFGIAAPWLHRPVPVYRGCGPIMRAEEGDEVASLLDDGPAVLLRAHGNVVAGESIEQTVVRATVFEQVATTLHRALAQGGVDALSEDELAAWREVTPAGHGKAWDYYRARHGEVE